MNEDVASRNLSMRRTKVLLFDFDGVIVDTFRVALEVNRMVQPLLGEEEYRRRFEGNINIQIRNQALPPESFDFFAEYTPRILTLPLVPGITSALKDLAKDYMLVIISSTISSSIREYLTLHKLDTCFTEILGNEIAHSKVKKIETVFAGYQVSPRECLFITDTLGDILEATEAGVSSLAVTWGYHAPETLKRGAPLALVYRTEELAPKISKFFE